MKKQVKMFLIFGIIILISTTLIYFVNLKNNNSKEQSETLANLEKTSLNENTISLEKSKLKENIIQEDIEQIHFEQTIITANNSLNNQEENENIIILNEEVQEELINISECSEEFMENYFVETQELSVQDDNENILIITSTEDITDTYGATEVIEAPNNQYFIKYDSEETKDMALEQFQESDDMYVEENYIYTLSDFNSWGIEKMGLDSAIKTAENSDFLSEVTVAIIDSGCNMDLFNQNYSNKIDETYNLYDTREMYDSYGHGTHIAGTIAEGTSSNVKILPVKVSDSKLMDTMSIITAINYITYYEKADVINMSFGGNKFNNSLYVAIEAASDKGIISIAAAGNSGSSEYEYPSAFDNTISVSAIDSEFNLAEFSNYGEMITFAAPGVNIESINGYMSGTSMAAPHVVCAVAILKGINTNLTLDETITLLKEHTLDLGEARMGPIFWIWIN